MPWLSEEIPDWDEMSDEERAVFRRAVQNLGMEVDEEDDEGYYE
jgi:predicted Fe-S protein YdhL (DUF1289 family)